MNLSLKTENTVLESTNKQPETVGLFFNTFFKIPNNMNILYISAELDLKPAPSENENTLEPTPTVGFQWGPIG